MLGNFVDIHNHILPGVDDGSKDMEETKAMIQRAIEQGIGTMIATPHYECGGKNMDIEKLIQIKDMVAEEASKIHKDFKVYLGHELMYSDSLLEDVKKKKALTLADSRYVLIEFSTRISYESMYHGMRNFVNAGYAPIIAHMERYECLRKDEERVSELINLGCYLQMNSSSLLGGFMNMESRRHKKLVADGYIHIIASDSHNMHTRVPRMKEIVDSFKKKFDDELILNLFVRNPSKILENKYI